MWLSNKFNVPKMERKWDLIWLYLSSFVLILFYLVGSECQHLSENSTPFCGSFNFNFQNLFGTQVRSQKMKKKEFFCLMWMWVFLGVISMRHPKYIHLLVVQGRSFIFQHHISKISNTCLEKEPISRRIYQLYGTCYSWWTL